jgi:hypothetical protein
MSKGHMEALAALKAMRGKSVTKPQSVTKPVGNVTFITKAEAAKIYPSAKGGRPKVHASRAQKQKAYRDRKKTHGEKAKAKG